MKTIAALLHTSMIDALDARVLLRQVLGVNDVYLIAHANDVVNEAHAQQFHALVARRVAGEPIAYIVGEREFYGHTFKVTSDVLIPRPETELLVELALEREPRRMLDLGTGSGCVAISIALALKSTQVIACDRSSAALAVARDNAKTLNAMNVAFIESDWYHALRHQTFDAIVSNPPYVAAGDAHLTQSDLRYEPQMALVGVGDGLGDIRVIILGARAHLASGGWLLFEHGYDQAARCRELLTQAGFANVQSWRDLAGIKRVSGGRAPL